MVHRFEQAARWRDFMRFTKQEISGLIAAIFVTAFIFSFRDWGGETFNVAIGLQNFSLVLLIAVISFLFRLACQKMYALSQGYNAEFKIWWAGLLIALIVGFLSVGTIPLIIIGGMTVAFMTRHRLGEFRYGWSYWNNAMVGMWAIYASLILAVFFAIGNYIVPQTYFFHKGLILNLIMAACALIPIPQLEGLNIFFGSRVLYFLAILLIVLAAILLLTNTLFGIVFSAIFGAILGLVYLAIGSEK